MASNPAKSPSAEDIDCPLITNLREISERNDEEGYLIALNEALAKVTTIDNGDLLVPLNADTLGPRIHLWLVDLEVECNALERAQLRADVVARLRRAAESLPTQYSLIVRDAFRTETMVWNLYALYIERSRVRDPFLTERQRDLSVRNLLAMPDDIVPPGHMTGGAVDVNLGDSSGRRVNLELPAEKMPRRLQAPTFSAGLPAEIMERRQILYDALTQQGFHNYFREYWHYSYGDAYWAVRRVNKIAHYGVPKDLKHRPQNSSTK